ncbi:MAG: hypothetical protein K5746_04285 [Clostridiales bacterium]|nr:hypothetical protein [Clostridiales bacterium]
MTTKILIFLLMVVAGVVFIGQVKKKNVWWLICLYWALLTIKNAVDFIKTL